MKTLLSLFIFTAAAIKLAAAADAPVIEVKNKSTFKLEASGRNPFWPIGWKPSPKVVTNTGAGRAGPGPDIAPTAFVISSITLDQGAKYAIINGKAMTEGQQFGLQLGTQIYQLTVKSIEDGQVVLSRHGQDIAVPLRRK